jgi:hypothetical protein
MVLEVVPPNRVLCCCLTILGIVESGRWNRGRNAVDICRLCKGIMNARLAIGFAAERVPFGIAATIERTLKGDWGSTRGIIFDENDAGRSRRHSGTSTLVCCAGVSTLISKHMAVYLIPLQHSQEMGMAGVFVDPLSFLDLSVAWSVLSVRRLAMVPQSHWTLKATFQRSQPRYPKIAISNPL